MALYKHVDLSVGRPPGRNQCRLNVFGAHGPAELMGPLLPPFPSSPPPFSPLPYPLLPLEVGPLNPAKGFGGAL